MTTTNKFVLFCFEESQPQGGWSDFQGFFNNLEEAKKAGLTWATNEDDFELFVWQIVDLTEGTIVANGCCTIVDGLDRSTGSCYDDSTE